MKSLSKHKSLAWTGVLASAWCLLLAGSPAVLAQDVTAKSLIDRAQIQDLITHYYYNFGRDSPENFSNFYADDAELILGTTHYKGKEGIEKAYTRPANSSAPAPKKSYSFNVTISNPLIVVHGDTATSALIFTEYVMDNPRDVPKIRTQGREYATFVKAKGHWRYKSRHIMGGNEPPDDWKE
jgi:SnoaL-like domain